MKTFFLAAAATIALSIPASAGDVLSNQGHHIALGDVNGSVYYTELSGEFEVVATLAANDSAKPIRTRTNLRDGQSMTVEVPGAAGTEAEFVTISRNGDKLSVVSKPDLRATLVNE